MFFYSDRNGFSLFKMFCDKQERLKKEEIQRFKIELEKKRAQETGAKELKEQPGTKEKNEPSRK